MRCEAGHDTRRGTMTDHSARREDLRLLTGSACFAADAHASHLLHAAFLRSDTATGSLASLDPAPALAVPGVVAVLTGATLRAAVPLAVNPVIEGASQSCFELLAVDKVGAVGQPLALVVATSADVAVDGVLHLGPVIDATQDRPTDSGVPAFSARWARDAAQAVADQVQVEVTIAHPRLAPCPMEPRAVTAIPDAQAGTLLLYCSTQTPHRTRTDVAAMLGLEPDAVRVIATDVGGAFGMKASVYPEEVAVAAAAHRLGRPIRWVASRSEEMLSASHGRGTRTRATLRLTGAGELTSLRAEAEAPLGHWLPFSAVIPAWNSVRYLPGPYRVAGLSLHTCGIASNTAPVGIYRGAGRPEAAMLTERLLDRAARKTGMDPLELRLRSLLDAEELPSEGPSGARIDSGDFPATLRTLRDRARYSALRTEQSARRARGECVGIGIACYVEPCGAGWESARITAHADGLFTVATGSTSQGHGRESVLANVAAAVLGVSADAVTVHHGDTAITPPGIGALASRSTAIGASAVHECARALKARLAQNPALPASEALVYHAPGEAFGFGAWLAVVSIDVDTGQVTAEQVVAVDDAGVVLDERLVAGQLLGGLAQGLGEALLEEVRYDEEGQLLTGSLMDYALPRAGDMPRVELHSTTTPATVNALGAKGVGEAGTIGGPAALTGAVLDALAPLGIEDLPMPMSAERIWRAIRSART